MTSFATTSLGQSSFGNNASASIPRHEIIVVHGLLVRN